MDVQEDLQSFHCIGLSYKTADETARGLFSLNMAQKEALLNLYKAQEISGAIVISTCNRTEIYGFAKDVQQIITPLLSLSRGTAEELERYYYHHQGTEAVSHIFRVATGLDSQILGDFEIIAQIKSSFKISDKIGLANAFTNRLINSIIQASKRIKTETAISSGATSVAFAAVQYILKNINNTSDKNILLFGTGKIGRNTCENLIKHINHNHITLINRTQEKANMIANKLQLTVKPIHDLVSELQQTDILIVATGASSPTVLSSHITSDRPLLILDLSVPKNVESAISTLDHVTVLHVDHLSQITDDTLERRKQYIPQAEEIIEEIKQAFFEWTDTRKFVPIIHALKEKLINIKDAELDFQSKKIEGFRAEQAHIITDRLIQKITTHVANHLKKDETSNEKSIDVIKEIFEIQ